MGAWLPHGDSATWILPQRMLGHNPAPAHGRKRTCPRACRKRPARSRHQEQNDPTHGACFKLMSRSRHRARCAFIAIIETKSELANGISGDTSFPPKHTAMLPSGHSEQPRPIFALCTFQTSLAVRWRIPLRQRIDPMLESCSERLVILSRVRQTFSISTKSRQDWLSRVTPHDP
jgi:hypothetical protein